MDMMRIGGMPDRSAIALSCSLMAARAGLIAVEAAQHRKRNLAVGTLRAVLVDDVEQRKFS